ncbi:M28 family peptidase [Bacteroidota bacterium]
MKLYALLLGLLVSLSGFGQQLFIKSYTTPQEIESLNASGSFSIHHVGNDFIIGTASTKLPAGAVALSNDPWVAGANYYLVWLPEENTQHALDQLTGQYNLLYSDSKKAVVGVQEATQTGPKPFVHGGVVRISPSTSWQPNGLEDSKYAIDTFAAIYDLMALVDTGEVMSTIRHLESYGTRLYNSPEATEAQNWIKAKFEEYPELEVELQDFPYGSGSSDNVIATLPGKTDPDQYIVIGSHYDSYAWGNSAPGADDNASGTAAVLELARILSQFEFDKSIVFCTFSAEEVGLVGSEYYASNAQSQGMDILGYFNFDMIGYRNGNDPIHTDMIAPSSATELVNFYKAVVAIYLPNFDVFDAQLSNGDSDHTSFNNNGYMGIFPFEDVPNYSPYIHSDQDIVGLSVNSPEMAETFIQANLASVVTLSTNYPVGIEDQEKELAVLKLFPNPSTSHVTLLSLAKEAVDVTIFNSLGQKVDEKRVAGQVTIDVTSLPAGVYLVKATSSNGTEFHRLIVNPTR